LNHAIASIEVTCHHHSWLSSCILFKLRNLSS